MEETARFFLKDHHKQLQRMPDLDTYFFVKILLYLTDFRSWKVLFLLGCVLGIFNILQ